MKQLTLIFTLALLTALTLSAQSVQWVSFEALPDSMAKKEKPILIFFEADWCKFCKVQDQTTFKDAAVVAELNQNYYCLRVNTESDAPIIFFGDTYVKQSARGTHELVEALAVHNGQLMLPTTIIIKDMELRARLQGMQDVPSMLDVFGKLK